MSMSKKKKEKKKKASGNEEVTDILEISGGKDDHNEGTPAQEDLHPEVIDALNIGKKDKLDPTDYVPELENQIYEE